MSYNANDRPKDLSDALLSEGRFGFSLEEAQRRLGLSERSARKAVERLVGAGRVFWAGRGLYVAIPPQFRSWGAIPASYFVDDLMCSLDRSYYVALLSAAEIHGASHHAPQEFQVMTDRPLRSRDFGRVRLRFITGAHVVEVDPLRQNTPSGTMLVSDRELTAVDLVAFPQQAGGLANVATILIELGPLDGGMLAHYAAMRRRAIARRLGWLLDGFAHDAADLRALQAVALPRHGDATLLSAGARRVGSVDRAWGVRVNAQIEPDV